MKSRAPSDTAPVVTLARTLVKPPLPLEHRWSVEVPGDSRHVIETDPASDSLYLGDGWGVPFAALRLHRMSAATGVESASLRTRHQSVTGLRCDQGRLLASTDTRLLALDPTDLSISVTWERRLVKYASQLADVDGYVVEANWLQPYIAILHGSNGDVRRLRVGRQPVLYEHQGTIHIVSGVDGEVAVLDPSAARLRRLAAAPPVVSVAVGADVWGVRGGPLETTRVAGVSTRVPLPERRRPTAEIVRLTGSPLTLTVEGPCQRIWCDDARGLLWCFIGSNAAPRVTSTCVAIEQATGKLVHRFETETSGSALARDAALGVVPISLVHLDVELQAVFTTQLSSRRQRGHVALSSSSTLGRYSLPAVG